MTMPPLIPSLRAATSLLLVGGLLLGLGTSARADSENSQQIADRYEQMLVRSPEPGTALDKVIDWYATSGGGLEVLKERWAQAAPASPSYLLLQGLLAERLRTPEAARDFYQQAMKASDDPAAGAKLLAALETTEGQFPAAATAYQIALASESLAPIDRMEIMRSLALLYQRSFDDEKASEVWKEALKRFPDDPYILEEAGEAFLTAGDYPAARSAFLRLEEISKTDPFRKIAASLRLARTAELDGKTNDAIKIYELALEETSADSWINREVRARIEELFRRKNDLPGLLAYYDRRTTATPQDFLALAAQADVLDDLGRGSESLDKLRSATRLAPENWKLRLQLLKQLSAQGQPEEALTEARELAKPSDAPPEALLALGNLLWEESSSRAEALKVWQRLAPPDSQDPAKIALLAELLSSKEETDAAIVEWQRLVAVNPSAADARQKLAQLFLKKDDRAAAEEIVSGLVAGDRATAENFLALARLQARLEWSEAALATTATALEKFPTDPELLNFAWRQALESNDSQAAARLFPQVWKSSANDFFSEDAVKRYVAFLETNKLAAATLQSLTTNPAPTELDATLWFQIAVSSKDETAATKALALLQPLTTPVRAARATSLFAEAFGTKEDQINALRAIAEVDPRLAAESLKSIAMLEADSGQVDDALATVGQLIDRTPADGSLYGLYADLAARAGKFDAATKRLEEGVRYAAEPAPLRLQLAQFLQAQGRNAEAETTLNAAFEDESNESRRMEIFRRQIELAMQSGTIEPLILSLREKQAKERGGARYGTYLAEIFLLQGDFLGAREELAKSLGQNPDDPRAIAKLMTLADQGGDQEEAIRLATRLVEIEPSQANRADIISRLLNSQDPARGLAEIEVSRAEIIKNPAAWSATLVALRQAGMTEQADKIIDEIAATPSADVLELFEIANLRLAQLDLAAAESTLWTILRSGSFPDAFDAVLNQTSARSTFPGQPRFFSGAVSFAQIASEVQNSLRTMFQPNQGRGHGMSRMFFPGQLGISTQQGTPEQRTIVRAFFLLQYLARARQEESAFATQTSELTESLSLPAQITLLSLMNDTAGLQRLLARQATQENADLESDRLFLSTPVAQLPESKADLEKIQARVAAADPTVALQFTVSALTKSATGQPSEDGKKKLLAEIAPLLQNPTAKANPQILFQLASLSASAGDAHLATECLDLIRSAAKSTLSQNAAMFKQQIAALEFLILRQQILTDDEHAAASLESLLENADQNAFSGRSMIRMMNMHGGFSSGAPNMLVQNTSDLVIGDSAFPFALFRNLQQAQGTDVEKIHAWFEKQATPGQLDLYMVGLVYADWVAGKKDEAIQRVEAIHTATPTPRSAALLLELYERSQAPAKALEVIDLAELQTTETSDVRTFRKIRALRAAGKLPEAKELGESLARSRVSPGVRDSLRNELQQLGIPTESFQQLANTRFQRPNTDRSQQIREQIDKLIADKKPDEAEKLALAILGSPLPQPDDHQTINLRQNVLNILRSQKRLDALESALTDQFAADPGDFDAAIRLMEIEGTNGNRKPEDRLSAIIAAHPERIAHLGYVMQILQRRSESAAILSNLLCTLIRTNPGLLEESGVRLENLTNQLSQENSGLEFAEAIAALDDDAFNRLFLRSRLSGNQSEITFVSQLAEICALSGKKDAAIALLKRIQPTALTTLHVGFMPILRLAELQLESGEKAAAAATMKQLFAGNDAGLGRGLFQGGQSLNNMLSGFFMNRMPNQSGPDQMARFSKLTTETGTMEALLSALDKDISPAQSIPVSLLLRTSLGQTNIADEWRKVALDPTTPLGFFQIQMLAPVLKALAQQKDAGKLIPAFLKRIPQQQLGFGGDMALVAITENLPILKKFSQDPEVKNFIASLIAQTTSDPNAAQYYTHTPAYPTAITTLIDLGYAKEARALLEYTKPARASSHSRNNEAALALIETRFAAADGTDIPFEILCAAAPQADGTMQVTWVSAPNLPLSQDRGNSVGPVWTDRSFPIPKNRRPATLTIFAGPNPAALTKVTAKKNPDSSGSLAVKLPGDFGLLQARWELPDGTRKYGPFSPYVQGTENLLPGLSADSPAGVQTGQPGPLGDPSAVSFERLLPSSNFKLSLGEIAIKDPPAVIALTGWIRTEPNGQNPQILIQSIRGNSSPNTDSIYFPQTGPDQWRQFVRLWTVGCNLPGINSLSKDTTALKLQIQLNANSGYNNQWQVNGTWAGLAAYRFSSEQTRDRAQESFRSAQTLLSKKDFDGACREMTAAFRLNPRWTANQPSFLSTFETTNKLNDVFQLLADPALYLPNPLDSNSPVIADNSLILALAKKALGDDAPPAAADWLQTVRTASLDEALRFQIDGALFVTAASLDPTKVTAQQVLDLLGFEENGPREDRIKLLWSRSDTPVWNLLALLDRPEQVEAARKILTASVVPASFLSASRTIDAWLLAPSDPAAALKLWQEATVLRSSGPNAISFNSETSREIFVRIGSTHSTPGDLIVAIRSAVAASRSNPSSQQRQIATILAALANSDAAKKDDYAAAWADVEIAGLGMPNYNASSERVIDLAKRLEKTTDWDRLGALLDAAEKNSSLNKRSDIKEEFERLRKTLAQPGGDS